MASTGYVCRARTSRVHACPSRPARRGHGGELPDRGGGRLRTAGRHRDAAPRLAHRVIAGRDGAHDRAAGHHVVHQLVGADPEPEHRLRPEADVQDVHAPEEGGDRGLGHRVQEPDAVQTAPAARRSSRGFSGPSPTSSHVTGSSRSSVAASSRHRDRSQSRGRPYTRRAGRPVPEPQRWPMRDRRGAPIRGWVGILRPLVGSTRWARTRTARRQAMRAQVRLGERQHRDHEVSVAAGGVLRPLHPGDERVPPGHAASSIGDRGQRSWTSQTSGAPWAAAIRRATPMSAGYVEDAMTASGTMSSHRRQRRNR